MGSVRDLPLRDTHTENGKSRPVQQVPTNPEQAATTPVREHALRNQRHHLIAEAPG